MLTSTFADSQRCGRNRKVTSGEPRSPVRISDCPDSPCGLDVLLGRSCRVIGYFADAVHRRRTVVFLGATTYYFAETDFLGFRFCVRSLVWMNSIGDNILSYFRATY